MSVLDKVQLVALETRPLDLGDYAEDYAGAIFDVWVTPSRAHLRAFGELGEWISEMQQLVKDRKLPDDDAPDFWGEYQERLVRWYAEMWRNIDVDEARQIRDALQENCPGAWDWLTRRTSEMVAEFRQERLKN